MGDTWGEPINTPDRFIVLSSFNDAAVLDQETRLVWEQGPSTTLQSWLNAQISCTIKTVGGRKGWRLPTIQELASLVDPSVANPALPDGHPFSDVQSSGYWSATTFASDPSGAWDVVFGNGVVGDDDKTDGYFVWCVRGGQGGDPQ